MNLDCSDWVQIMCKCLRWHFSVSWCSNLSSVDLIACCFNLLLFDNLQTETGSGQSPHSRRREAADVGADYERNKWNCNWIRKKIRWGFFSLAALLIIIRDSLSFHAWSVLLCTLDVERELYSPKTTCSAINMNGTNLKLLRFWNQPWSTAAVFLSPHVLSLIFPIVVSLKFSLRMYPMHHCWCCFCKWMIFCVQLHIHILSDSNTSMSLPRYCFSATWSTAVFCLLWVFWTFQYVSLLFFRLYIYLCAVIESFVKCISDLMYYFLCSAITVWLLVKYVLQFVISWIQVS